MMLRGKTILFCIYLGLIPALLCACELTISWGEYATTDMDKPNKPKPEKDKKGKGQRKEDLNH